MSAADRSYRLLVGAALAAGSVLLLPLALTVFPAEVQQALHRVDPFVTFCAGLIEDLRLELPPLGAGVLALVSLALASAGTRTAQILVRTERVRRSYRIGAPPQRLLRAARRVRVEREVRYVRDARPFAHCVGLLSPVIVMSDGALRRLRDHELDAVLWHEAQHLRKHDPLRVLVARALAALFVGLPLIEWLALRFEIAKELDADQVAMRELGDAAPLAGALLALGPHSRTPALAIGAWSLTVARIDQLSGASPAELMPKPGRSALLVTIVSLVLALGLTLGQGVRAHTFAIPLDAPAHPATSIHCPLPPEGILL